MNDELLQIAVPSDIGAIIDELAKEKGTSRPAIVRQLLIKQIRQAEIHNKTQTPSTDLNHE